MRMCPTYRLLSAIYLHIANSIKKTNILFQLSWIREALEHPDIFCLANYNNNSVNLDVLEIHPDEDDKAIMAWKCLDLVDILLWLSENGFAKATSAVFEFPMKNCPDVLTMTLMQTVSNYAYNSGHIMLDPRDFDIRLLITLCA
jgi:hypothetical protein